MSLDFPPIPGTHVFQALHDRDCIVLATNVRIFPGIGKGIMRAAKDLDAAIIFEIAKSESDLSGGYTGMTPGQYAKNVMGVAREVGHDIWVMHADHITIKKGDEKELSDVEALVSHQIDSGFTSFAIDASHLFDFKGQDLLEELSQNIHCTTRIAKHIMDRMGGRPFGLEVEVGEIGKETSDGRVLTKPEEAVVFIEALKENGVDPDVIAIANGSAHGNTFDAHGNLVEQISIDIPQTIAVAKALRERGLRVRIAQHGITGTPRELIGMRFPKGDIIKGNVATFYQNMVFDLLKVYDLSLYEQMREWVVGKFSEKLPAKTPNEVFGKWGKKACSEFYDALHGQDNDFYAACEATAYAETLVWLKCFNAKGSASIVRKWLKEI